MSICRVLFAASLACAAVGVAPSARADETPPSPSSPPSSPCAAQLQEAARTYYEDETTASFLFFGYGAVFAGVGAFSLTQQGDFTRSFGWTSLVSGGVTALGGLGYLATVKVRGGYYQRLAGTDLARFKQEEQEHVGGTARHSPLYLGGELLVAVAGIGLASYGLAAKNDTVKGIGAGVALEGISLFVIDVPGAVRASRYDEQLRRFNPQVGVSLGGGDRPWGASIRQSF